MSGGTKRITTTEGSHRYGLPGESRGITALTPRERELLVLYVEQGTYLNMAHAMGIGRTTVRNMVASIIRKLDLDHLGQAAVLYDRTLRVSNRRVMQRRSGMDRRRAETKEENA